MEKSAAASSLKSSPISFVWKSRIGQQKKKKPRSQLQGHPNKQINLVQVLRVGSNSVFLKLKLKLRNFQKRNYLKPCWKFKWLEEKHFWWQEVPRKRRFKPTESNWPIWNVWKIVKFITSQLASNSPTSLDLHDWFEALHQTSEWKMKPQCRVVVLSKMTI